MSMYNSTPASTMRGARRNHRRRLRLHAQGFSKNLRFYARPARDPTRWTTRESSGSRRQRRERHPGPGRTRSRGKEESERQETTPEGGEEGEARATARGTSRRGKQAEERRRTAEEGTATPPGGQAGGGNRGTIQSPKTCDKNYTERRPAGLIQTVPQHCIFPYSLIETALPDRLSDGLLLAQGPAVHARCYCHRVRVHYRSPL